MLPIIGALLPVVGKVLDRLIPDVAEREKAKMELQLRLAEQEGELLKAIVQSDVAQAEINKVEAQSDSLLKSGWRPALAWICVSGFAWTIYMPLIKWILMAFDIQTPELPSLGGNELMSMTFGLLGLTGARSWEKKQGLSK